MGRLDYIIANILWVQTDTGKNFKERANIAVLIQWDKKTHQRPLGRFYREQVTSRCYTHSLNLEGFWYVYQNTLFNAFRQQSKNQRHHFATKFCIVKSMAFPIVRYRCESWTIKKAEHQRTDAFEMWFWRRLLKTTKRSNQPILKKSTLNIKW